jgi:hypothetical protein
MGNYDTAQICLNGHAINDTVNRNPEFNQKFCDKCGSETITTCPTCHISIRGDYHVDGVIAFGHEYLPPSYCYNCGNAFPWLQAAFDSAKELLDIDESISDNEKGLLISSMKEISKDTSKTEVNALKIKKLAKKLGSDTYDAFIKIAVDVGTEIAKKSLLGS